MKIIFFKKPENIYNFKQNPVDKRKETENFYLFTGQVLAYFINLF